MALVEVGMLSMEIKPQELLREITLQSLNMELRQEPRLPWQNAPCPAQSESLVQLGGAELRIVGMIRC